MKLFGQSKEAKFAKDLILEKKVEALQWQNSSLASMKEISDAKNAWEETKKVAEKEFRTLEAARLGKLHALDAQVVELENRRKVALEPIEDMRKKLYEMMRLAEQKASELAREEVDIAESRRVLQSDVQEMAGIKTKFEKEISASKAKCLQIEKEAEGTLENAKRVEAGVNKSFERIEKTEVALEKRLKKVEEREEDCDRKNEWFVELKKELSKREKILNSKEARLKAATKYYGLD